MEKYLGILKRSNTFTSGLVSGALAKSYPGRAHSDTENYQKGRTPEVSLKPYKVAVNSPKVLSSFVVRKGDVRPEAVEVNRLSHSVSSPTINSTTTYQPNNNTNDQVYLGDN